LGQIVTAVREACSDLCNTIITFRVTKVRIHFPIRRPGPGPEPDTGCQHRIQRVGSMGRMPLSGDVKRELWELFREATRRGRNAVEVSASHLHQRLEEQECESSSTPNRIAVCSAVLIAMMDPSVGDELTRQSESDPSVRFVLPRPTPTAPAV